MSNNRTGANGWHGANRPANATERRIAAMLLENTGTALMDSGMYGRQWERARMAYGIAVSPTSAFSGGHLGDDPEPAATMIGRIARVMRAEPSATIDRWGGISASTFHFLADRLTFDRSIDARWQRFAHRPHPDAIAERAALVADGRLESDGWRVYDAWKSESWPETIERWFDHLRESGRAVLSGLYGDGEPLSENTYNGAEIIDRTLQYWHFSVSYDGSRGHWTDDSDDAKWIEPALPLPEDTYTLLQIHGGADVRGGYTAPVLFSCRESEGIISQPTAGVACSQNGAREAAWEAQTAAWPLGEYGHGRVSPITGETLYGPDGGAHSWDTSYDGETLCTEDGARLEMETVVSTEDDASGTVDGCTWECPFGDGGTLEPFAW